MSEYIIYFEKHVTKSVMRYGIYNTIDEAQDALAHFKSINTTDSAWIESRVSAQQLQNIDTAITKLSDFKAGKAWYNKIVFEN